MASPAARTSSPAFPALRAHGIHSGVSGQRSAKAEGGRGGRPGSAPPLRRVWEEQVVLGAGVFAGSGWSEQTLGGQGWAPEGPAPCLFLSANLVRSGRRGGHPAKLAGRRPQSPGTCAWQGLESTGKRPPRPHPHLPAGPRSPGGAPGLPRCTTGRGGLQQAEETLEPVVSEGRHTRVTLEKLTEEHGQPGRQAVHVRAFPAMPSL